MIVFVFVFSPTGFLFIHLGKEPYQSNMSDVSSCHLITQENLCTRKVQSSRGVCSRRVHKKVYLHSCLEGLFFGQYFTSENVHHEIFSLINQAMYLLNIFCGLSDSHYSARVKRKNDFFLKKSMKKMSAFVREFMLTSA